MSISGKSMSTLKNYSYHVAKMALHFGVVPTELDEDQINDYLYLMQQQHKTPSESYFKFTVYGLRYVFRLKGLKDKHIALPQIKKDKRLPIVLSREEIKRLMKAPKLLKHRVLRCFTAAVCVVLKFGTCDSTIWILIAKHCLCVRAKVESLVICRCVTC